MNTITADVIVRDDYGRTVGYLRAVADGWWRGRTVDGRVVSGSTMDRTADAVREFPQDLRDATPEQREEAVRYFVRLPLAELRRRQTLNESVTTAAYRQLQDSVDPAIRKRLERALSNAQTDAEILTEAVYRKEFPACGAV